MLDQIRADFSRECWLCIATHQHFHRLVCRRLFVSLIGAHFLFSVILFHTAIWPEPGEVSSSLHYSSYLVLTALFILFQWFPFRYMCFRGTLNVVLPHIEWSQGWFTPGVAESETIYPGSLRIRDSSPRDLPKEEMVCSGSIRIRKTAHPLSDSHCPKSLRHKSS